MVENNGGQAIVCGTSQREFMNAVMEQGEQLQWKLCFDGIWAAITLLDYLNVHEVSFDTMINKIPVYCKKECEVECPDNQKAQVISQLYDRFRTNRTDLTHGLKIYQNNGWVLMVPDRYRHYIKIITEGVNMEAAEEISALFKKEIKKSLQNPRE